MKRPILALMSILLLTAAAASAQTPLSPAFTYQGTLNQSGQPFNGNANFVFSLYDAEAGGNLIGSQPMNGVSVGDGRFTVLLNENGELGATAFNGERRWLQISVNGAPLQPRQEVTAAPYALQTRGLLVDSNLRVAAGGLAPLARLSSTESAQGWPAIRGHSTSTANVNNNAGIFQIEGPVGSGVRGISNATTGGGVGVWGESRSLSGTGVYGVATTNSGPNTGVEGRSNSPDGEGVYGYGAASTGDAIGIHGETASNAGRAVFGEATAASGTSYGGYFESASSGGIGVHGSAPASGGATIGVFGNVASTGGRAVYATSTATTGSNFGVYATNASATGYGVYSLASATSGANHGGYFESRSSSGRALYGHATATSGNSTAVYGRNESPGGIAGLFANAGGGTAVQATANGSGAAGDFSQSGTGTVVRITNSNAGSVNAALLITQTNTSVPALNVGGIARVDILEIAGADVAEKFPVTEKVEPGMVVMIDATSPGRLCLSRGEYNTRVAGVVSGANGLPAGTILGHMPGFEDAPPIAMSGRVWVHCDASRRAVEVGDLLTTSDRPGHAMTAADASRSHGAIIGKAMTALPAGETGLVLVLINLH